MLIKEGRVEVKENISGLLEGEKITSRTIEKYLFS